MRWAEHFEALLDQDSDADPTTLDGLSELPRSICNLSQPPTGQLSAPSNTNPLVLTKYLQSCESRKCTSVQERYITKVWADENIPHQWRDANIVTIHKNKR